MADQSDAERITVVDATGNPKITSIRSNDSHRVQFVDANGVVLDPAIMTQPMRRRISASNSAKWASNSGGFTLSAGSTSQQARLSQRTVKPGRNVQIDFVTTAGAVEAGPGGDGSNITIRAAVEYPAGVFYPAYTNDGNRDATVTPGGGIARLLVPGFEVPGNNQEWWIRYRVVGASTGAVPYVFRPNLSTEWATGPNGSADFTTTNVGAPTPGSGNPGYSGGPNLVTYEPYDTQTPCVIVVGDSITEGQGDDAQPVAFWTSNPGGWAARAMSADGSGRANLSYSYVNLAQSGGKAAEWVNNGTGRTRLALIDEVDARTAWVLWTNDISDGAATAMTNISKLWIMLANRGLRVIAFTVPPRSNSSDNWATVGNQTQTYNTGRNPVNQWMRAGAPLNPSTLAPVAIGTAGALTAGSAGHPIYQVVDICPGVETAQDSGIWKATGSANGYTVDGTHPSATGYAAMAAIAAAQAVPNIL